MLQTYLARLFARRFAWLQVEVTTHCQAACIYCPRTVYRDCWSNRHMSVETFRGLLADLKRADLVYLQGWGEPFLHPGFFTMAALAQEAGCRVGTTTNGMHLDGDSLRRLVDLEVAVLAFSLAGVGEKNDAVRRGTRFDQIIATIKTLHDIKTRKGASLPKVHIAYMLLRSGVEDLSRLPQALKGLGVDQVVVSTLDFVAAPALARESFRLVDLEEYRALAARLADLAARGREHGLSFHSYLPPPGQPANTCPENIERAMCLAADGAVAPCVFLNLPVQDVSYVTRSGEHPYRRLSFGWVKEQTLFDIWHTPAYRRWRRNFSRGNLPPFCLNCLKIKV